MRALISVAWIVVGAQCAWSGLAGAQGSVAASASTPAAPAAPSSVDVLETRAAALCAKAPCTKEVLDLVAQARRAAGEARARLRAGDGVGSDRAVAVGDAAIVLAELVGRRAGLALDVTRARARTDAARARAESAEKAASRTTSGAREIDARPRPETAPPATAPTDAGGTAP